MSITKITDPGAVPAAVADYEAQNELIKTILTGLAKITLSNYDNDSAPAVKVGSVIDIGSTAYIVSTANETPTGYSGISVSTTFYLYYDKSAGVFIYSSTAPTWNDAYQGWYNGDDRAFFSMYKDSGGTLYEGKTVLGSPNPMANFPIGYIYTQYPTKKTPIELGFIGTWSNISSEFAGDFFRAEGGAASTFESGAQSFSTDLKSHTHATVMGSHAHSIYYGPNISSETWLYKDAIGRGVDGSVTTNSTNLGTKTSGTPSTGGDVETRPVNRTVRIWERIS